MAAEAPVTLGGAAWYRRGWARALREVGSLELPGECKHGYEETRSHFLWLRFRMMAVLRLQCRVGVNMNVLYSFVRLLCKVVLLCLCVVCCVCV